MTKRLKRKITEVLLLEIDEPSVVDRVEIDPEGIAELAENISEIGLLQPVLLRPMGDRYEIVAGHRRFLACQKLGLSLVDAVIKEMTDQEAAIIRASENLARENLTPIEEAVIFGNLITNHAMTLEKVAKKFGYKPGTIRRRMDILKMPPLLQQAVHKKKISVTVAEELWPISDLADLDYYLTFAIENGCTKETARGWCKEWKDSKRREKTAGVEGGQAFAPSEPRPVYVPCDLCSGAMEIGQETVLRVCPGCYKIIKQNM
jgi:ParB family chromosome partitioning protein